MTDLFRLAAHRPARIIVPVALGAILALTAACGGGGSALDDLTWDAGRINCEGFNVMKGYRYTSTVTLDLKERPAEIEASGGDTYRPDRFEHTQIMDGEVEPPDAIKVTVSQPVQDQTVNYVFVDGRVYFAFGGQPWDSKSEAEAKTPVPYPPVQMCNAIGRDLYLDQLQGTPEEVNGIQATKYHVENLQSEWPDNHPSFTASSDVSRYVSNFTGDIWVADEGHYIVKIDISGAGQYENGRGLEVIYSYELFDVDKDIDIKPPA
jgi:hypothetical protein